MTGDAKRPGALSGVRVLDFTWALAGPFGTMQLADLGAEVVKVEHPETPEKLRGFGPYYEGISTFFFSVNRGKQGICIDLKDSRGKELVKRLAREADVVTENFRPGTMDRLGLGYTALSEENPRLIYAALSGFGQTGPYSQYAAVDAVAQAMGGTMALNGEPDAPPMRMGVSIGDMAGGLYLAIGILAALRARDLTGRGQLLDVALTEAQIALCENAIVQHSAFASNPTRTGHKHPLVAPFAPYTSADGYIVVANVKEWELFCGLIDRDDLALDERFANNRTRLEHVDELDAELHKAMSRRTTDEWFAILRDTNVCSVGKVNSVGDLFEDEHVQARGMLVDVAMPYGLPGSLKLPASPIHLSETPADASVPMPDHGGHTDEVLSRWVGASVEEIAELRCAGVVK